MSETVIDICHLLKVELLMWKQCAPKVFFVPKLVFFPNSRILLSAAQLSDPITLFYSVNRVCIRSIDNDQEVIDA